MGPRLPPLRRHGSMGHWHQNIARVSLSGFLVAIVLLVSLSFSCQCRADVENSIRQLQVVKRPAGGGIPEELAISGWDGLIRSVFVELQIRPASSSPEEAEDSVLLWSGTVQQPPEGNGGVAVVSIGSSNPMHSGGTVIAVVKTRGIEREVDLGTIPPSLPSLETTVDAPTIEPPSDLRALHSIAVHDRGTRLQIGQGFNEILREGGGLRHPATVPIGTAVELSFVQAVPVALVRLVLEQDEPAFVSMALEGSLDREDWIPLGRYDGVPEDGLITPVISTPTNVQFLRIVPQASTETPHIRLDAFEVLSPTLPPLQRVNVALRDLGGHGIPREGDPKQDDRLSDLIDGDDGGARIPSPTSFQVGFLRDEPLQVATVVIRGKQSPHAAHGSVPVSVLGIGRDGVEPLPLATVVCPAFPAPCMASFPPTTVKGVTVTISSPTEPHLSITSLEVYQPERVTEGVRLEERTFMPERLGEPPTLSTENVAAVLGGGSIGNTGSILAEKGGELLEEGDRFGSVTAADGVVRGSFFTIGFFDDKEAKIERIRLRYRGAGTPIRVFARHLDGQETMIGDCQLPSSRVIPAEWFSLQPPTVSAVGVRFEFPEGIAEESEISRVEIYESAESTYSPISARVGSPAAVAEVNVAAGAVGGVVTAEREGRAIESIPGWEPERLIDGMVSDESGSAALSLGWKAEWNGKPLSLRFQLPPSGAESRCPDSAFVSGIVVNTTTNLEAGMLIDDDRRRQGLQALPSSVSVRLLDEKGGATTPFATLRIFPKRGAVRFDAPTGWGEQRCGRQLEMVVNSVYGGNVVKIGEIEVLSPLSEFHESVDLLHRGLGGTVIQLLADPRSYDSPMDVLPGGPSRGGAVTGIEGASEVSGLLAFKEGGAATVSSIAIDPVPSHYRQRFPQEVSVSLLPSLAVGSQSVGSLGPVVWERPEDRISLSIPGSPKARFVRVTVKNRRSPTEGTADLSRRVQPPVLGTVHALGSYAEMGPRGESEGTVSEQEVNDTPEDANPLAEGDGITAVLTPLTEVDVFRVSEGVDAHAFGIEVLPISRMPAKVGLIVDGREIGLPRRGGVVRATLAGQSLPVYVTVHDAPPRTVLLVDDSGSMEPHLPSLQGSLRQFIDGMLPDEQLGFIKFSDQVTTVSPLTTERLNLQAKVAQSLDADGGTALYEGIERAAGLIARVTDGAQSIVLLSDGVDTSSQRTTMTDAWKALTESNAMLFVIALGEDMRSIQPRVGGTPATVLRSMVEASGGRFIAVDIPQELPRAYAEIAETMRAPARYRVRKTASAARGTLRVTEESTEQSRRKAPDESGETPRVKVIIDASGSMRARGRDGVPRFTTAKRSLEAFAKSLADQSGRSGSSMRNAQLEVWTYGHRLPKEPKEASCRDAEQLVPPTRIDPMSIAKAIGKITPKGQTAIGYTLSRLRETMESPSGRQWIIVLTDGEETCNPLADDPVNPANQAALLRQAGLNVTFTLVGLSVASDEEKNLRQMATAMGAQYLPATDDKSLVSAFHQALRRRFTVEDVVGASLVEGVVGGDPVTIPTGRYVVLVEGEKACVVDVVAGDEVVCQVSATLGSEKERRG